MCLPVASRPWAGRDTAFPVAFAADLLGLLAGEFGDRTLNAVGDAAYYSRALLEAWASITTWVPVNAALYDLAPLRPGKRGSPGSRASAGTAGPDSRPGHWPVPTVVGRRW